jgi:Winged helix-turn helix
VHRLDQVDAERPCSLIPTIGRPGQLRRMHLGPRHHCIPGAWCYSSPCPVSRLRKPSISREPEQGSAGSKSQTCSYTVAETPTGVGGPQSWINFAAGNVSQWYDPRPTAVTQRQQRKWTHMPDLGWSCQVPERRALQRDEQALAHWKRYPWPAIKKA